MKRENGIKSGLKMSLKHSFTISVFECFDLSKPLMFAGYVTFLDCNAFPIL